jgi:hypothetical protein
LFRRFVTTRADKGGSGLGLAIVRAVAEAHAGSVELSSSGPPEVEFRMALPPARRHASEKLREAVSGHAKSSRRPRAASAAVRRRVTQLRVRRGREVTGGGVRSSVPLRPRLSKIHEFSTFPLPKTARNLAS